jgi:outer membrane lipoprotein-sorting protein
MMKMKTAMVLAAVSVLVSGCAETKSQAETRIQNVSAQDPWYMIYGWQ